MKLNQTLPFIAASAPLRPAAAPQVSDLVTTSPASPTSSAAALNGFGDTVAETMEDWGHAGKKLGSLAAVTFAVAQLPMLVVSYTYQLPMAVVAPLGIATSVAAMALTSWEEKHLGIGKKVGHLVGAAAGAVAGAGKATVQSLLGREQTAPAAIELEKREPLGMRPRVPLLQRGAHALQRSVTGQEPVRNRTIEIGEMIGSTAATLGLAYAIPHVVGNMVGGPIGAACSTLAGPLCGLVAGGFLENVFGAGRTVGELAGRAVSKVQETFATQPVPSQSQETKFQEEIFQCALPGEDTAGPIKKAFFKMNHIIGQPLMGFLVDTTLVANQAFRETAYQSIGFAERPSPQINYPRLQDNFLKMCGISGKSGHEHLVGDEIIRQVEKLGATWERKPDGSVIATFPASPGQEDSPTVMLSAHQDTVAPTNPADFVVGERRIHTNEKGILGADDRAGIAEILEGVTVVKEQNLPHPELKLVFPVDEERGLVGAGRLTPEDISNRPTLGFVVDALDVRDVNLTNDAVIMNLNSVKYNFSQEDPLVQVVFRSMANAGTEPRALHCPIMNGAGSDANTLAFNSKNIRSIAVGAGERDMHTPLEYIKKKDLEAAARHVVGYITNSCDLKVEGDRIVPRLAL